MTKTRKLAGILGFCAGTLAGILTGCSTAPQQTPEGGDQVRKTLNEGYSLLHGTVSQLKHTDKILLVKIESDPVDALISEISKYAAALEGQLEQLAKEHSALRLELKVLPQIEVEAQKSAQRERIRMLLAERGREFERLLLLTQSGTLNRLRHLVRVMHEAETNAKLKTKLEEVQRRFDEQYRKVVDILEKEYFSHSRL